MLSNVALEVACVAGVRGEGKSKRGRAKKWGSDHHFFPRSRFLSSSLFTPATQAFLEDASAVREPIF